MTTDNGSNFVAAFKRFETCFTAPMIKEVLQEPKDNDQCSQSLRVVEGPSQREHAEASMIEINADDEEKLDEPVVVSADQILNETPEDLCK